MGGLWSGLAGVALLGVAAFLVLAVITERATWLNRIWWPLPWEKADDEHAPRPTEFSALIVGACAGMLGFFLLAGALLSTFL